MPFSMRWKYTLHVLKHKWFVFVAGFHLRVSWWQLLVHDWTKFTPSEFRAYAWKFFGLGHVVNEHAATIDEDFAAAWLHHMNHNPHHWEYWLRRKKDGAVEPLQMPRKYVEEMVADWLGAGRSYAGKWDVWAWYEKNMTHIVLHPATRTSVENLLVYAAEVFDRRDDAAFLLRQFMFPLRKNRFPETPIPTAEELDAMPKESA